MPPPLDLAGRRFGKLLVIARSEGKTRGGYWLCRCDCGREEIIPAWRLPYLPSIVENRRDTLSACTVCTYTVPCRQCGAAFVSQKGGRYCSEACRQKNRRASDLENYHRVRKIENPDINKQRNLRLKEKLAADPAAMEAHREREKRRSQQRQDRLRNDPIQKERANSLARQRYAAKAEQVQARKRQRIAERLAAMTPAERASRARVAGARRGLQRLPARPGPETHAAMLHALRRSHLIAV